MEDLSGKQLGPYRVTAPLGEGGMASVYKAFQPAMDRYVALKILPRQFASDPEFIGRFRQEAKVLARLQHPHILPVFDYGEAEGYTYIVMPFISSGTLADCLYGQPLALQSIRTVISQVGDALDYAHSQGLIHRDVKPSNILIDERWNCLLTDFGITKIVASTASFTHMGSVIGTPAYMSPEQGTGGVIDNRSDIYSLGVVLYELATGRQPFSAETPIAVVYKHIQDPLPPPRLLNPNLPEAVERVIAKAMAKQPQNRYATARDMVAALQSALPAALLDTTVPLPEPTGSTLNSLSRDTGILEQQPATPEPSRATRPRLILMMAVILLLGLIGGLVLLGRGITAGTPAASLAPTIATPSTTLPAQTAVQAAAATLKPTATYAPSVTPRPTSLPIVASSIAPEPTPFGGGQHIAFVSTRDGNQEIYVMNTDGTDQTNLTVHPAQDTVPDWSPDDKRIAFESNRDGNWEIYLMNADGSGQVRLTNNPHEDHDPDWSPDGQRIVFHSDREDGVWRVWVMNVDGSDQKPLTNNSAGDWAASWSPDGQRLAFASNFSHPEIYSMDTDGGNLLRLTNNPARESVPHWSPDGRQIVFYSERDGNREVYVMNADGSDVTRLTKNPAEDYLGDWSPDGQYIIFTSNRGGDQDIYLMRADGGEVTRLTNNRANDFNPSWSAK
jgi:Tol biopolymer transport system component